MGGSFLSMERQKNHRHTVIEILMEVVGWLVILVIALLVLRGRYLWETEVVRFSRRGYLSSAYMLVVFLPTLYYGMKQFVTNLEVVKVITALLAVVFTLPYYWLGLDRWYYNANQPITYPFSPGIPYRFQGGLFEGLKHYRTMPYEISFFVIMIGLGIGVAFLYYNSHRNSPGESQGRVIRNLAFWLGLYMLILLQTWLHFSTRNPGLYEELLRMNNMDLKDLPVAYFFPQNQGAVSCDYPAVWRPLEEHFMGLPKDTMTMLIRRSFPYYIASQFSYFFPPYYVGLARNIIMWFLASLCMYLFARGITGNSEVSTYAAALTACGTGFIFWAGSPESYLTGYAIIPILLYLFWKLFLNQDNSNCIGGYVLFGSILGLGSMVYDIFPWYTTLILFAILWRLPLRWILISLAVSVGVYFGFLIIQQNVLQLTLDDSNYKYITYSVTNLIRLKDFDLGTLYVFILVGFTKYFQILGQAFYILPLLTALIGLFFVNNRSQFLSILVLMVPPLLVFVILYCGGLKWDSYPLVSIPRLHFPHYVGVYIASGYTLLALRNGVQNVSNSTLSKSIPVVIIVLIFILNNIDVFGFHEFSYYFMFPLFDQSSFLK